MSWQDIVLSIGTVLFIAALIPSVRSKDKPHLVTSLMNGSILVVFAVTYLSLELFFSFAMTLIVASLWLLLAWQKHSQK